MVAEDREDREVHIPAADIEVRPEAGSPVAEGVAAHILEAHIPVGRIEHPPEQDTADIPEADTRIREARTAGTTEARTADITADTVAIMDILDIVDTLDTTVDIMAAGAVTGMVVAHTTGSPLVGTGSARGGIPPMVTLIIIRTTTPPHIILTPIRIRPTRVRISRTRSIVNQSNPTGTIARIRRVIFRMLKVAPVDGPRSLQLRPHRQGRVLYNET